MLYLVKERFDRIASHHLDKSGEMIELAAENRSNDKWYYYMKRADEHIDMAKYWHNAAENLHYIPGTWSYRF